MRFWPLLVCLKQWASHYGPGSADITTLENLQPCVTNMLTAQLLDSTYVQDLI